MQLIGDSGSPYVRKVRVALAELGITDKVELVPCGGTPGTLNQETSGKNPVTARCTGCAIHHHDIQMRSPMLARTGNGMSGSGN